MFTYNIDGQKSSVLPSRNFPGQIEDEPVQGFSGWYNEFCVKFQALSVEIFSIAHFTQPSLYDPSLDGITTLF